MIYLDCGDPTPANGTALFDTTVPGSFAYIPCDVGFTSYDDYPDYQIIYCNTDGKWVPFSSCEEGTESLTSRIFFMINSKLEIVQTQQDDWQ